MTATLFPEQSHLPGHPCAWSPCRRYRYVLWRLWGRGERPCMFIGLNPSTADETQDDPTVRRCIGFAKAWGCDSLVMTNIFAWRSTDPAGLRQTLDPVGVENDRWLTQLAESSAVICAAWGVHGSYLYRDGAVAARFGDRLQCLGKTKDGHPRHPLYVRADVKLEPWP